MDGKKRLAKVVGKIPGGQREAAAVLGVAESTISRLLDGTRAPSLRQARAIQELWGIPMDTWLPAPEIATVKVARMVR